MNSIYDEPEDPYTRVSRWNDKLEAEVLRLEQEIKWQELKERLHLRLIASGNDELAKRGERIVFLEGELKYWAKEARGGFGEDEEG